MAIPVTLEEARRQIRLQADDASRDDDLNNYIADAAAWVEKYTGHLFEQRDVTETVRVPGRRVALTAWPIAPDAVPAVLGPDLSPVVGVRFDPNRPARVSLSTGQSWPLTSVDDVLTITVRAGYDDPADVPRDFKRAMLVLIGAYDADREGGELFQTAVRTAEALCRGYRLRRV